jgi:hypothetical protein
VRRATLAAAAAALLAAAGACIKVVHDAPCDLSLVGTTTGGGTGGGGPPVTLHAQALYVVNLQRSTANLAGTYADLIHQLNSALSAANLNVDQYAVLPLYGGIAGAAQLIYGDPSTSSGDLSAVLSEAALSGQFDHPLDGVTAEQQNLATVAAALDTATLPPDANGGKSPTFFAPPKDLFLVVTLQSATRLCADTDAACALGGVAPVDAFSATAADGSAGWLKINGGNYPPRRVYQLFIATGERESFAQLQASCTAMPGFPRTLIDSLQPSQVGYYGDLSTGLTGRGWNAEQLDFCSAIATAGAAQLKGVAARVAAAAAK